MTEELKQCVDNISLYAKRTCTARAMNETMQDFCTKAVMSKNALAKENLLPWWIGVVMQSEALIKNDCR
jgi:hypothetical protein